MKKEIKRYEIKNLKQLKDKVVTIKLNGDTYTLFKQNMKEQSFVVSDVINQFMVLTNDLLQSNEGGEVCFIFEPTKEVLTKYGGKC